jgi:hypothetical protein
MNLRMLIIRRLMTLTESNYHGEVNHRNRRGRLSPRVSSINSQLKFTVGHSIDTAGRGGFKTIDKNLRACRRHWLVGPTFDLWRGPPVLGQYWARLSATVSCNSESQPLNCNSLLHVNNRGPLSWKLKMKDLTLLFAGGYRICMNRAEICEDPVLRDLPHKIESDRWGHIPSNAFAEFEERRRLFERGASEVWLGVDGQMQFFTQAGPIARSNLCPNFPREIKVGLPPA